MAKSRSAAQIAASKRNLEKARAAKKSGSTKASRKKKRDGIRAVLEDNKADPYRSRNRVRIGKDGQMRKPSKEYANIGANRMRAARVRDQAKRRKIRSRKK